MRKFGIVGSTLWRSDKFRLVGSDAKLTYVYLLTSIHGNSAGAFVLPPPLAAMDMRRDLDAVEKDYDDLARVGLIRYDSDDGLVQITNFFRFNAPSSRKHLAGPKVIIDMLPSSPVRDLAICELVVSMVLRAREWKGRKEAADARADFLHDADQMIKKNNLLPVLMGADLGLSDEVLELIEDELSIGLSIGLSIQVNENGNERTYKTNINRDGEDHGELEKTNEMERDRGSGGKGFAKNPESSDRPAPRPSADRVRGAIDPEVFIAERRRRAATDAEKDHP